MGCVGSQVQILSSRQKKLNLFNIFFVIIGFCGGTGSGKSVLVKYAYDKLGPNNSSIISLDQYYKDFSDLKFEERCNINFAHPTSIDFELIVNQLSELKNGNPVHIPIYSYKKHKRLKKTEISYPKKFILVDGILIFSNKKLLELIDKKIYIECEKEKRVKRRIKRDIKYRGRTEKEVIDRFEKNIHEMHEKYVKPHIEKVDIIINNDENLKHAKSEIDLIVENLLK